MEDKKQKKFVKEITSKEEDFSQWYTDVILKTDMVDYAPVRGCMVIKPYGYGVWEGIKDVTDRRFKETGHKNAYFPLLIPENFLQKEADHFEGFAPEVLWVTHGGSEKLSERLFIRPTSETIICTMYSKWIKSYRDLPVLMNQWCNVIRWEKTTRPFLRTAEFLWQEGHTVHETYDEAQEETLQMLEIYREVAEDELAMPVILGEKSIGERFAGADKTYTMEAMMYDGKALQAGTSHNLGQNFAKMFNIQFLDRDGKLKYGWSTSWGISTRLIGGIIMVHGDNRGLKMPPRIAPIQVVVLPIASHKEGVMDKAYELFTQLKEDFRVELDDREGYSAGWKFNEWEMKGVPLRLEIGPRDIEKNQVTAVRRDTLEKFTLPLEGLNEKIAEILDDIHDTMFKIAANHRDENTHESIDYDEIKEMAKGIPGFIKTMWCGSEECEEKLKSDTGLTIRCIPFEQKHLGDNCPICGKEAKHMVYIAKAY
ncbi:proline--tRNA ligase [Anaerosalibacter massiliensis]|uniref:Proline--tRNA ligase n=1 Tax=Anaerosalibacter massiliensis TaxID=1347392 RepID=A0A9X2S6F2_9FIRM|nr:proline--tRNA ligase [Anaerosalibacter massiliensis]MCR2042991.1 proline--tRNA ligase [Anaerosalibacter massiliensis]